MFRTAVVESEFRDAAFMLNGSFSTREVLQMTGATARQLQWWDEHRLIVPLRAGRKRTYSQSDLADILVVLELRRRHISLHQVRRVLRFLKTELHARVADLVSEDAEHPLPDYHLLIEGDRLYLETDSRQIFDLLKSTEQAVFLISLADTVRRLQVAGRALVQEQLDIPMKSPARAEGERRVKEGNRRIRSFSG